MRTKTLTISAMIILLAAIIARQACTTPAEDTAGSAAAAEPCDRQCLEGFVYQYVDAMVAHDPSGLSLAETAKFTENGHRLELGEGLWNTISDRSAYILYMADPEAG